MVKHEEPARRDGLLGRRRGPAADAGEGTDFHAVEHGYVSVTPLQIDLTNRDQMAAGRGVAGA